MRVLRFYSFSRFFINNYAERCDLVLFGSTFVGLQ